MVQVELRNSWRKSIRFFDDTVGEPWFLCTAVAKQFTTHVK